MPRLAPVTTQALPSRPRFTSRSGSTGSEMLTVVSPVSALWTGHLPAMTRSFSIWSSSEARSWAEGDVEAGRDGAFVGRLDVDLERADVPALAVRVHLDRDRRARSERSGQEAGGGGAGVRAAGALGLVGDERVPALDLDVVGVALAPSGDYPHRLSRPCRVRRTARDRRRRRSAPWRRGGRRRG